MALLKSLKALLLVFGLSATLNAGILEEIEKLSPNFFNGRFDRELYDLDKVNGYDKDEYNELPVGEEMGQKIDEEDSAKKILRLQQRKQNCVKNYYFPKIKFYKEELSKLDPQTIIPGLIKSSIHGLTTGAGIHYLKDQLSATFIGGGSAFASSALQLGVDIYFNPTVASELKRADILCNRLIYEINIEAISDLEAIYIRKRQLLSEGQRKAIEMALLAERKPYDKHPDLKGFVTGIIDMPRNALIVPPGFVTNEGRYGDIDVDNDFVEAREYFLKKLFPSLETTAGVPVASTDSKRKLDTDFYPRPLRERFKEIIGKICDYSYKSLAGEPNAVELRGIIFQGKPGTGKSQAAKLIASSCGLPYNHVTIQGELDLDAIWGSDPGRFSDGHKGAIASSFLTKNEDNKTAKNAIIILDDIDRSQADDVLAFLMKLLDTTNMPSFLSRYFDFEIGMEDILVILTINTDWYNNPTYSALKSRADFVLFPDTDVLRLKEVLKETLSERDFRLSTPFKNQPTQWDNIRREIVDFIIDDHDVDDNRQRISRAKTLLRYPQAEWSRIAQNQGW